jgi:ABC-type proline/glycine betaine transport system permease subunit
MAKRPLMDIIILMVAATICSAILISLIAIAAIELINPDQDTTVATATMASFLNILMGLLAGFIAGRTERKQRSDGPTESNH